MKKPALDLAQERTLFFVSLTAECATCDAWLPKLLKRAQRGVGLDIYFVGADIKDNAAIQTWAAKRAVPREWVRNGRVTLNYDQASLAPLRHCRRARSTLSGLLMCKNQASVYSGKQASVK